MDSILFVVMHKFLNVGMHILQQKTLFALKCSVWC